MRAREPEIRDALIQAVETQVLLESRNVQPSAPTSSELELRASRKAASSKERIATVETKPNPCRPLSNSFWARYTPYPASGSISCVQRLFRLSTNVARSRAVTAVSPPTFQLPATFPVSFNAPRM